jgi:hypothetical protein
MNIKDGWVLRYDARRGEWVRWMPVEEWEARGRAIEAVNEAGKNGTIEDARAMLLQKQAEIKSMKRGRVGHSERR